MINVSLVITTQDGLLVLLSDKNIGATLAINTVSLFSVGMIVFCKLRGTRYLDLFLPYVDILQKLGLNFLISVIDIVVFLKSF